MAMRILAFPSPTLVLRGLFSFSASFWEERLPPEKKQAQPPCSNENRCRLDLESGVLLHPYEHNAYRFGVSVSRSASTFTPSESQPPTAI